jgi:hypothetical protein
MPDNVLSQYRYILETTEPNIVLVSIAWPDLNKFRVVGTIRRCLDQQEISQETDLSSTKRSAFSRLARLHRGPGQIDFRAIRSWLSACDSNHPLCEPSSNDKHSHHTVRFVDVAQNCIVTGTTAQRYVALSYVWGKTDMLRATLQNIAELERPGSLHRLQGKIAQTILDAMELVAKLKMRYLWVDALCIVQDHAQDKHNQISLMHEIYSSAHLTVVQQAGFDANAGLPGVHDGTRSPLVARAELLVARPLHEPPEVLTSTVHSSRGWTLQEILVSKRCLHFFDKHLTMICVKEVQQDCFFQTRAQERAARKASVTSLAAIPWEMNPLQSYRLFEGAAKPLLQEWLCHFEIFARIVQTYSCRTLSYSSDVLFAFSGLASALSELSGGSSYYGVLESSIDLCLLWIPIGSTISRRTDLDVSKKFYEFPSWSWAGWEGEISYNSCQTGGRPMVPQFQLDSYLDQIQIVTAHDRQTLRRKLWPPTRAEGENFGSQHLQAWKTTEDTQDDPLPGLPYPIGCLLFWAEESLPDELRCIFPSQIEPFPDKEGKPHYTHLYLRQGYKQCGVVALMDSEFLKADDKSSYSFILLSETRGPFSQWLKAEDGSLRTTSVDDIFPTYQSDEMSLQFSLNVLLVKKKGPAYYRLGFGQISLADWLATERQRSFIRLC